ncbi:hypothetical protein L798_14604 [Zootermopsis nevadensis]|uniref:Transmembrane protein n=1 Tax=Zootermopsis nevadensis TaxID=136037 RepID=A0A067QPN5_ZOONE|nr:hypothetical protein L798_14604 [Zootermopsis nevadensis]
MTDISITFSDDRQMKIIFGLLQLPFVFICTVTVVTDNVHSCDKNRFRVSIILLRLISLWTVKVTVCIVVSVGFYGSCEQQLNTSAIQQQLSALDRRTSVKAKFERDSRV